MILKTSYRLFFCGFTLAAVGCGPSLKTIDETSTQAVQAVGCGDFVSYMYDNVANEVVKTGLVPDASLVEEAYRKALTSVDALDANQKKALLQEVRAMSEVLQASLQGLVDKETLLEKLTLLSQKAGDLPEDKIAEAKLIKSEKAMNEIFASSNATCNEVSKLAFTSARAPASTQVVQATNKLMAVYFQSCEAPKLPPLRSSDPSLEGVRTVCTEGVVGCKRYYQNLNDVLATHHYIEPQTPNLAKCANVREKPPIYDFGGRPTMDSNRGRLNFFQNYGGTEILGIDCSAYIASVFVSSGLRLQPDRNPRAMDVNTSTSAMLNWNSSNSCFNGAVIAPGQTQLAPGDVILWRGHVVLVDSVGADPFGLKGISNISQCESLSPQRFNFTISQSSPYKGSLGLQRSIAADYFSSLGADSLGRKAVMAYARAACRAGFIGKPIDPQEKGSFVLLRHSGAPNCRTAEPIALEKSTCVAACQ
jgi:hypothetical protein